MRKILYGLLLCFAAASCADEATQWYTPTRENKPHLRWWWMGCDVDEEGITYNMEEFARKGFGGVEITPIYGLQGNDDNDMPFLSPEWMEAFKHTVAEGERLGLQVDLNNSTGWPFGGPWITPENAAKTYKFNEDTTELLIVGTGQMVKRSSTRSGGLVMDHYSRRALMTHLDVFGKAFAGSGCPWPHTLFDDSFEVYGSGWAEGLSGQFYIDHGYRLEDHLKAFARNDGSEESTRVIGDYRSSLSRYYLEEFAVPWTQWAHQRGMMTRIQAHGAPSNLIDVYAACDIAECESFGQSPFNIKGLHRSGRTRMNDSDEAVFKFASSASHIAGRKYTSCELLTWLTEHFHTSLALCKPELDLAFASGVNHVHIHGAPYSPEGVEFPGWKFYATINMSPTNRVLWDNVEVLTQYITRCQAFLSAGEPDADFLIYFPVEDVWRTWNEDVFMQLDIHSMDETMPQFKKDVLDIIGQGYDVDYVSDAFLEGVSVTGDGGLVTAAGTGYKALVLPSQTDYMPEKTRCRIEALRSEGARVLSVGEVAFSGFAAETACGIEGIHICRRINECGGKNYFIANLGPCDIDTLVTLATRASAVELMDPMNGRRGMARSVRTGDCTRVRLQLRSGESILVKTFPHKVKGPGDWVYYGQVDRSISLGDNKWKLSFDRSEPPMPLSGYVLDSIVPWSNLPGGDVNEAVGVYETVFALDSLPSEGTWTLEVDDVRECAEVIVNGECAGAMTAAPFALDVTRLLHTGENILSIRVWNLPANRIAQMDREGKVWRIFKDANIAGIRTGELPPERVNNYGWWDVVPSGINSDVRIVHRNHEIHHNQSVGQCQGRP